VFVNHHIALVHTRTNKNCSPCKLQGEPNKHKCDSRAYYCNVEHVEENDDICNVAYKAEKCLETGRNKFQRTITHTHQELVMPELPLPVQSETYGLSNTNKDHIDAISVINSTWGGDSI
jgi:hypothetical protein